MSVLVSYHHHRLLRQQGNVCTRHFDSEAPLRVSAMQGRRSTIILLGVRR